MASNIVVLHQGRAPSIFAGKNLPDMNKAAQEGLLASYAVISYKGRNWRIKYRGEEELLKDPRTGAPVATLDVVIVGVSPNISKQYYEKRYSEGDDASPDCWSLNGKTPDPTAPKKQCNTCAACPQNIFGSRITEAGKKAKACQDSRRIAVVPAGDIANESYGGPMLLRLPPMSLSSFAAYGNVLNRYSAQPYMVQTTLGFNYDVAYPLITFNPSAWLDDEQGAAVAEQLENPLIERIMEFEAPPEAASEALPEEATGLAGGKPPAALAPKATTPKPAVVKPPVAAAPDTTTKAGRAAALKAELEALEAAEAAESQAAAQAAAQPAPIEEDEDAIAIAKAEAAIEAAKARAAAKAAAKAPKAPSAAAAAAPSAATAAAPSAATAAAPPKKGAAVFGGGKAAEPIENAEATTAKTPLAVAPASLESAIDELLAG
jgi:hypothetical protein